MPLPSATTITNQYLYGQDFTPQNLIDVNLTLGPILPSVVISASEYMDPVTGPGRFALGSMFELVQEFFDNGLYHKGSGANCLAR